MGGKLIFSRSSKDSAVTFFYLHRRFSVVAIDYFVLDFTKVQKTRIDFVADLLPKKKIHQF